MTTRLEELMAKATKGLTPAQIEIGNSYIHGKDSDGNPFPQDSLKGRYWLERAHERGASTATVLLGKLYEDGMGVAVDISKAIEYYEQAAQRNAFLPCLFIARIHANRGVSTASTALAVRWYEKVLSFDGQVDDIHAMDEARKYLSGR